MYQIDPLKEYIDNSELRVFSDKIKVRLSSDLAHKYDSNHYNNYLNNIKKCFDMIDNLNISYPGCANPNLYIYIVPDDKYIELLNYPMSFVTGRGGGKPVTCFDLDGFNSAYGISQSILEDQNVDISISRMVNITHELAHIVHSMFFSKNRFICEGFADALALYTLDLEKEFEDHRTLIKNLTVDQILSAHELIESEKNNSFGKNTLIENKSCSFRNSYVSSYLFIRGCMNELAKKYNLSRKDATQKFLEILRNSSCTNEYLVFDISMIIGIKKNDLLNGKDMQLNVIVSL